MSAEPAEPAQSLSRHHNHLRQLSLLHCVLPYCSPTTLQSLPTLSPAMASLFTVWKSAHALAATTHLPVLSQLGVEYTTGMVIGEGGYKTVFAMTTTTHQREALSVMNLSSLQQNGLLIVAQQEVQCSLLLSLLTRHHIAPLYAHILEVVAPRSRHR